MDPTIKPVPAPPKPILEASVSVVVMLRTAGSNASTPIIIMMITAKKKNWVVMLSKGRMSKMRVLEGGQNRIETASTSETIVKLGLKKTESP